MSRVALGEMIFAGTNPASFASGRQLTVCERSSETPINVYDAESGGSKVTQPLMTDEDGRARGAEGQEIWVDAGSYDLRVAPLRESEDTQVLHWEAARGDAEGGGGGGGAVDSVAGKTGVVLLEAADIEDLGDSATKFVGTAAGDVAAGDVPQAIIDNLADNGVGVVVAGTDPAKARDDDYAINLWIVEGIEPENRELSDVVFDLETSPGEEEGIEGPPGPEGPAGPEGPKGDTGAAGAKGEKGDTGSAGEKGATGEKGAKGDAGATGPEGPKGEKGATGSTGSEGPKGSTGAEGPQGPKGDTGAKGETGPPGEITAESVDEGKLKNLAVSAVKLAANAVTAAKIAGEAVETAAIKALNVTTAKIAEGAVTAAKLGAEAVESAKIKSKAIVASKIGDLGLGTEFAAANFTEIGSHVPGAKATSRVPIKILHSCTLTGIAYEVGGTSNGKVLVALYDSTGARLAKSASATQSTAQFFQRVPFESTVEVGPGVYYAELIMETATGTFLGGFQMSPWTRETLGSFAVPASITPPSALNNSGSRAPFIATY